MLPMQPFGLPSASVGSNTIFPSTTSSEMTSFFMGIDNAIGQVSKSPDGSDLMTWANGLVQQAALRKQQQAAAAQQKAQAAAAQAAAIQTSTTPATTGSTNLNGSTHLVEMLQNLLSMLMSQLSTSKS